MSDKKQTCILVLGMHRSGTSAVAGALSLLDVYLGSDLMKADGDNAKGYYENNNFYQINQSLLEQINSSWDDVFYDEVKLNNIVDTSLLKKMLQKEFTYSQLFAIKDPRLVYLFPIYEKILNELNIDIKIVIPYRNPLEVGASLLKRNNISLEKGMLLWVYHILIAEKFSRNYPRIFIAFDELMTQFQKILKEVSKTLDIDLYQRYEKSPQEIDAFLEPSLKHHNIESKNISDHLPSIVLSILEHKIDFNETKINEIFDDLMIQFYGYRKLFFNQDLIDEFQKGQKAVISLYNMNQELEEKYKELDIQENVILEQKKTIDELLKQLQEGKNGLNHQASVVTELESQLQDKQNRLNHQDSIIQDKENGISKHKATIAELLAQLKEGQKALKYQAGVVTGQKDIIHKLQTEHEKDKSGLKYQSSVISEQKDSIDRLDFELEKEQKKSREQANLIALQKNSIEEFQFHFQKREKKLHDYVNRITQQEKENIELKKELAELYGSKSWRWMRFARKIMRKFK